MCRKLAKFLHFRTAAARKRGVAAKGLLFIDSVALKEILRFVQNDNEGCGSIVEASGVRKDTGKGYRDYLEKYLKKRSLSGTPESEMRVLRRQILL